MGVGIPDHWLSKSSYDKKEKCSKKTPNPDPYNWILNDSLQMGRFLLIDITYPDCTNYEGRKIMLYENTTLLDLKNQKTIDPHFSSNKRFYSPIARFEPTKDGWQMAQELIKAIL